MTEIKFFGHDLEDRVLFINKHIEESTAEDFAKAINKLISEDNKIASQNQRTLSRVYPNLTYTDLSARENTPKVTINLSTFGGSCYDGWNIYDSIQNLNNHAETTILCSGKIMSMGIPILLAVDKEHRKATKNTTFMIHQVSSGCFGMTKDIEDEAKEGRRLTEMIYNVIMKETNISKEMLDENFNKKEDWMLTAEQAKTLGIIGEII